jgi:hypothetical protein
LTVVGALSSLLTSVCYAEDQQNGEEYYYEQDAEADNNNEEENQQEGEGDDYYYAKQTYVSDGIDYWTDYSILPMSCITQ